MTAQRTPDPTISYLVLRGILIGLVLVVAVVTGLLVYRSAPGLQMWVISAIESVRDEWTSWDWTLL